MVRWKSETSICIFMVVLIFSFIIELVMGKLKQKQTFSIFKNYHTVLNLNPDWYDYISGCAPGSCPIGQYCGSGGSCVAGCTAASACPPGTECDLSSGAIGTCTGKYYTSINKKGVSKRHLNEY